MKRNCKQFAELGKKNQVQFAEWYKKNPKRRMSYKQIRSTNKSFSSYNCGKSGLYLQDCRSKQSNKGVGDRNKGGGRVMNLEKTVADLTEKLKL